MYMLKYCYDCGTYVRYSVRDAVKWKTEIELNYNDHLIAVFVIQYLILRTVFYNKHSA